ncbi:unnamed protein product [Angiostrongylus costaricensis]|uniref:ZM domain-containing protein n=1 Tax=Angiostrongylus costaricensis TaxID=334426 RepID=A0A158PF25_ANGCS|nr:unnamed protein product [Angiostrongylus costaricensis]
MSHHYKLAQGIKGIVDTSPPFSMYNSPISVHYVPKRASSADAIKRRQPKLPRPHRELVEFIGEANSPSLRLPLPLKGIDVKPKILQSRNYQPPLHRNRQVWSRASRSFIWNFFLCLVIWLPNYFSHDRMSGYKLAGILDYSVAFQLSLPNSLHPLFLKSVLYLHLLHLR